MKNVVLVTMFLFANAAMATTIQKVLPADAYNVRAKAVVDSVGVGSRLVSDSASEGPVYETIYEKRLVVTVKYESKSQEDVSQTGSGLDGQILPTDDQTPTLLYFLKLSPAKLQAVLQKKISANSLISSVQVQNQAITLDDPSYQYKCLYDNEYNKKVDPKCQENPPKVTQVRPVLKLEIAAD